MVGSPPGLEEPQDRGVSSVVAVVLMMAVATVLGSIVDAYSFGLLDGIAGEATPQASFSAEQAGAPVNITHTAGEPIPADRLFVVGGDLSERTWAAAGGATTDGTVRAGDSLRITPTSTSEPLRLVWRAESGDRSSVLRTIEVRNAGAPAFGGTIRTGSGFGDQQFDDATRTWTGRARYGGSGDYEMVVGDTLSGGTNTDRTWSSGTTESFELTYDGSGTATLTVGGVTVSDSVSVPEDDAVSITVRAPGSGTVAVEAIRIDGTVPATDSVTATDGADEYIIYEGVGTADGFTVTGGMTFTWAAGTGRERPSMYIDVD
jgi:FlaG/FlaF family flagellin (archaellin)